VSHNAWAAATYALCVDFSEAHFDTNVNLQSNKTEQRCSSSANRLMERFEGGEELSDRLTFKQWQELGEI
jgi:hypothetical protein